jgi:hypothetical protein
MFSAGRGLLSAGVMCGLVVGATPIAAAATFNADAIACISKAALDESFQALIDKDQRHWQALFDERLCVFVGGRDFSVVSRHFLTTEVRVYAGGSSVILWVTAEDARGD